MLLRTAQRTLLRTAITRIRISKNQKDKGTPRGILIYIIEDFVYTVVGCKEIQKSDIWGLGVKDAFLQEKIKREDYEKI